MDEPGPSVIEYLNKTHSECVHVASSNYNLPYTIGVESNIIGVSVQLPTPALPKRLSLIFLSMELS